MIAYSQISRAKFMLKHSKSLYVIRNISVGKESLQDSDVKIPNRKDRSPVDILYALSSTVKRDPTSPHFKYHDDPYLIPMSNIGKRTFALAQESGRKAARWIIQENPELFMHTVADPPIEKFQPIKVFNEQSEVDENCLNSLIDNADVLDAITVYKVMQSRDMKITDDTKQKLLELIAFYNQEESTSEEYLEEKWFKQGITGREPVRKTWKDSELAEELFNNISCEDGRKYSAVIRGMCMYFQVDRAWEYYLRAKEQNIQLDSETYNDLISVTNFLKEDAESRWKLTLSLLQEMKEKKLKPNLGTLNSVVSALSKVGSYKISKPNFPLVLSEFRKLNIKPCPATWLHLLTTYCRDRGPTSTILVDILNSIEGTEFRISHPKDTHFFATAMEVCRNHLHDKELAYRVDKLLHCGKNYDLIGDSSNESRYYRNFIGVVCDNGTLEEFLELYELLVPNVYVPEPGIMEEILKFIERNGAINILPKIWCDMVSFDHINRENLIQQILQIMVSTRPSEQIDEQNVLSEQFSNIAWDIYTRMEEMSEHRNRAPLLNAQMLSDMISLFVRGDDFDKANLLFEKLERNQHTISGTPSQTALTEFSEMCIQLKQLNRCFACLQYCVDAGYQNGLEIGRRMMESFTLDEASISKIRSMIGDGFLHSTSNAQ